MRIFLVSLLFSFAHAQTYLQPDGPIFHGESATIRTDSPSSFKVMAYNINFSRDLDAVEKLITTHDKLKNPDIILLQEIVGFPGSSVNAAASLAARLKMNYVFIPGQIHPKTNMDYGSAILSPWPMTEFQKIILPGKHWRWRTQRAVVGAKIKIGNQFVRAYSAHFENMFWDTFTHDEHSRAKQVLTFLAHAPKHEPVVVGGDFNAINPSGLTYLLGLFWWDGFTRVSSMLPSENKIPIGIDHIFIRGLEYEDYGTAYDFSGSDHAPVWADLKL